MVSRKVIHLGGMACVAVMMPALASAGTLGLAWDPSAGAAGYRIHYGTVAGQYTMVRDVGNVTQTTLTDLGDCTKFYFSVTAYNGSGESGYSNEVGTLPRPSVRGTTPSIAVQGSQVTLTVRGANFAPGAGVTINNPNVFLDGVQVVSCTEIQMVATIEPTAQGVRAAEVGKFTVTVTGLDGLTGAMSQAFQVMINPTRFDLSKQYDCTTGWLDGWDTNVLSRVFGSQAGDNLYQPDADLDGDGSVDGNDLAYLGSAFGKHLSGTAWISQSPRPTCHY